MSEGSGFWVIHRDCASFNRALWKSWHILHLVKVYVVRRSALSRIMMDGFFCLWHVDLTLFILLDSALLCVNQYGRLNAWSLLHDFLLTRILARIDVVLNTLLLWRESAANIRTKPTCSLGRHFWEDVGFAHSWIDGSIGKVAWTYLRWVPNLSTRCVFASRRQGVHDLVGCRSHNILYVKCGTLDKALHRALLHAVLIIVRSHSKWYLWVVMAQIKLILCFSHLIVYFFQIRWESCKFDFVEGLLELHLDFLYFVWLLFFFCLEIEVINVLRIKWLYPFRDNETLLEQLHLFILAVILCFMPRV